MELVVGCRSCGHQWVQKVTLETDSPFVCPKCGQAAGWQLFNCSQCKKTFVPEPVGDPPRLPIIPSCPTCGQAASPAAESDIAKAGAQ